MQEAKVLEETKIETATKPKMTLLDIVPYVGVENLENWNNLTLRQQRAVAHKICTDGAHCFVGEAHGGNNGYEGCNTCNAFSGNFPRIFSTIMNKDDNMPQPVLDVDAYNRMKEAFVEHWNFRHV